MRATTGAPPPEALESRRRFIKMHWKAEMCCNNFLITLTRLMCSPSTYCLDIRRRLRCSPPRSHAKKEKTKKTHRFLFNCLVNEGKCCRWHFFFPLKLKQKKNGFVRSKEGPQKGKYCGLCVGPNMKEVRLTARIVSKSWKASHYFVKDAKKGKKKILLLDELKYGNATCETLAFELLQSSMFAPCNHKAGE